MNFTLISAAIAAAIGFGTAWQIQSWRMDADEDNRIEIAREQEREISRLESKRSLEYIDAQNRARQRESKLRMDAATASAAVAGLRRAADSAVQAARTDPLTCPDTSAAFGAVLVDISSAYSELAITCDRHVSDLKTLSETWPH